jgi:hypothetical protein
MSEIEKLYEHSVKEVRDALNRIAEIAYEAGRADENADIMNYLKQQADKLEATRPKPYKDVLPALDMRIYTIRKIVEHLELKGIDND